MPAAAFTGKGLEDDPHKRKEELVAKLEKPPSTENPKPCNPPTPSGSQTYTGA